MCSDEVGNVSVFGSIVLLLRTVDRAFKSPVSQSSQIYRL